MTSFETLLPNRPVRVLRSGKGQFWPLVVVLVALGLVGGLLYWQAPPLWRDYQISRDYSIVAKGEVRGGRCETRKAVFTDCNVDIAYPAGGAQRLKQIEFMFLSFGSGGDYIVDVVRSNTAPDQVTISLALEKLWNRVALAGVFLAILLAMLWAGLRGFVQGRASAKLLQPVRLTPIAAAITNSQDSGIGSTIAFHYAPDANTTRKSSGFFKRKEKPLIFGDGLSLAVLPEGGKDPILMDEGLLRVDFTDAERSEIFRKLGLAQG